MTHQLVHSLLVPGTLWMLGTWSQHGHCISAGPVPTCRLCPTCSLSIINANNTDPQASAATRLYCIKISVLVLRNCPTLPISLILQLKFQNSGLGRVASADYFQGRLVPLDVRQTNSAGGSGLAFATPPYPSPPTPYSLPTLSTPPYPLLPSPRPPSPNPLPPIPHPTPFPGLPWGGSRAVPPAPPLHAPPRPSTPRPTPPR